MEIGLRGWSKRLLEKGQSKGKELKGSGGLKTYKGINLSNGGRGEKSDYLRVGWIEDNTQYKKEGVERVNYR